MGKNDGKFRGHSDLDGIEIRKMRNYNQQFARNTIQPMI
jgi:hypothetical protein